MKEFEGGQTAYGHAGLCVRAVKTEEGQARLTWMGTDAQGKVAKEVVLAEHCAEVDVKAKKPRPLFDFKRQSFEKKLRILGRCGINDVMVSAPLEAVGGTHFKPEGCHIQMWITLLEQVFPELIGYNADFLEAPRVRS